MSRGRGAHYVPRVKDRDKREVSFSIVPSNLGKKGKVCSYSASGKFEAMNAEFDPEKNKVEVVVSPRYELKDAVAYLNPVNETKNTSRPELFAVTHDGVTLGRSPLARSVT